MIGRSHDGSIAARPIPGSTSHSTWDSRLVRSPFLTPAERQILNKAMSPPCKVKARTDLTREGECADSIYVIIDGWACRYATTRKDGRQFPALFIAGDVCNLDTLLLKRLDHGIHILSDAIVAALSRDHAIHLATQYPGIARTFAWLAMMENIALSRLAVSLGRRSAQERLAHLLCELSVRLDAERGGESCYGFPLTQEQIGDALGLTSVHVNRTMQRLRDDGLVRTEGRMMTLPDMARLRRIGEFDQAYLHLPTELSPFPA